MKTATPQEFQAALAQARWPSPEFSMAGRSMTSYFKLNGEEVAEKTSILKRGRVVQVHYWVNEKFLTKRV